MRLVMMLLSALDTLILAYVMVFFAINIVFVAMSKRKIGSILRAEHARPALGREHDRFLPIVTLLVPAYNEEAVSYTHLTLPTILRV